jgi:ABC-2 type transport system ATP-binding protein
MIRCDRASVERGGEIVVESVSCGWPAGRAVAVIGRAGAGKTSLLAAVAAVMPLHGGDILVEGHSVRRAAAAVRRRVGYVPATPPRWPGLRAREFLELFAATVGLAGAAATAAVDRGLALAGLGAGAATLETLAAGPAKMLLVARALMHDPRVLVLDDPFAGLDPPCRIRVERLIDDAQVMGRTVMAAIDDAAVPGCFTDLAVLREGRLVAAAAHDRRHFETDRRWNCRLVTPGSAAAAVHVLAAVAAEAHAIDGDAVACRIDPGRATLADLVAAVVRAGLAVEQAGFDPPWPAQLLE